MWVKIRLYWGVSHSLTVPGISEILLRHDLGKVFRELAKEKESEIEEGHLIPDHVHALISIPQEYSVSQVVGCIKGKSAIHIARNYTVKSCNYTGQSFWARGYFVSKVGRDEKATRDYIKHQQQEDHRIDQLMLFT